MTTTRLVPDDLLADLDIPHQRDVPLGPKTWYGVGGPAEVLATPASIAQVAELARRCHEAGIPLRGAITSDSGSSV